MQDPLWWSFPIGRMFGINIRVHIMFPIVAIGLILRLHLKHEVPLVDLLVFNLILFLSVLLHEFGHCVAGRWVGGEATDILMWPLGGLAYVEVPRTPRANMICTLGGPAVNVALCIVSAFLLAFAFATSQAAPYNPFSAPFAFSPGYWPADLRLAGGYLALVVGWTFWINWVLLLFNMVLVAFPMDGGRIMQCILWRYVGYHQATLYAVFTGFGVMFLLCIVAIFVEDLLLAFLALYIYSACKQQWILLETGGEESLFGYDFSQGYTSLERDQGSVAPPRRKQPNVFQRWWQRRQARKMLKEQQRQADEESRMDQLLEKIAQHGKESLTDEEQRFLKKVSDRYRNRH